MKPKQYLEVHAHFDFMIKNHEIEIKELKRRKDAALKVLQQKCLEENGSHQDDGAFMHGSCVRCGANLG